MTASTSVRVSFMRPPGSRFRVALTLRYAGPSLSRKRERGGVRVS